MPIDDLLFIHPLLNMNEAWSGYLVEGAHTTPDKQALLHLGQHPAIGEFDPRVPWLLPATPGLADNNGIKKAIYLFTGPLGEDEQCLDEALLKDGHLRGRHVTTGEKLPQTGTWDTVVISTDYARTLPPYTLIGLASQTQIVVTDVHSHTDYNWGKDNAWGLTTTEFLLAHNNHAQHADMTRIKLLEILLLIDEDADTRAIEDVLRQEPKLSYSLLRLVNSVAISAHSPITSFAQAITLLGRRQLQRWLQLLVFADPNDGHRPNPLLQKAAARGRQMEVLASLPGSQPKDDTPGDAAFMVGVFSLLNVLLNMSMSEILQRLPLAKPVHLALTEQRGPLGELLQAICAAEKRDFKTAARLLEQSGINGEHFLNAQLAAYSWASHIHPAP